MLMTFPEIFANFSEFLQNNHFVENKGIAVSVFLTLVETDSRGVLRTLANINDGAYMVK